MKMTTKGKYAVSTMCELAISYAEGARKHLQARDIAERHFLSEPYVEQILNKLKRSGLIKAVRGPQGGYFLARNPKAISVSQILEATEGPITLDHCCTKSGEDMCRLAGKCKTIKFWTKFNSAIQNVIDKTTLADIC